MYSKICILGSTGFVGGALYERFIKGELDVLGLSRNSDENNRIVVDFNNAKDLKDKISSSDVIINAMGSYKPSDFLDGGEEYFLEVNDIVRKIDESIEGTGVKRFIQISSAGTVYGEFKGVPFQETDITLPETDYGRLKVLEEYLYRQICEKHKIEYVCLRLSNPFGNSRVAEHGFVDVLAASIRNKSMFKSYAGSNYRRDFIHIDDMASIIEKLSVMKMSTSSEIFNIGSGNSESLHGLAKLVNEQCENVEFVNGFSKKDINIVAIDNTKVNLIMGDKWTYCLPVSYLKAVMNQAMEEHDA